MSLLLALTGGGGGSITGTLAATEAQDTAAINGVLSHTGTLAATEAQDTAAFSGKHGQTGVLAATESQDVAAFVGAGGAAEVPQQAGAGSNKKRRIHPRYIYDEPEEVAPEVVAISKRTYKEKPRQIVADVWDIGAAIEKLEAIVKQDDDEDIEALLLLI